MTEIGRVHSLADVLASRRRALFVGRASEIELVRACLDADDPPFTVLYLHGPGGIGKSSLLEVLAAKAASGGFYVRSVDCRGVLANPEAIAVAVYGILDSVEGTGAGTRLAEWHWTRSVLLLDSYERWTSMDDWVRTDLIPELPSSTLVVIAGRLPPSTGWRADPAWQGLLRTVALRNLLPQEAEEFLRRCAVPRGLHQRLLEHSYGHPLGLSLLADLAVRVGDFTVDRSPDLVSSLLERFLDAVPEPGDRHALLACALARVTTEPLLRAALDVDDARAAFDWLRSLSFVESGPEGLSPHDLARDVIERDLRWRDPDGYRVVFRRVRAHIHQQVMTQRGEAQQRGIFEEKFVFRNLPSIMSPVDWTSWGSIIPRPAQASDRTTIRDLIERFEGPESAALAVHWFDRQPEAFLLLRRDSAVGGVIALLDLSKADPVDRDGDPGTRMAWDHVMAHGGIRAGERVTQTRFIVDAAAYQSPSATLNAVPIVTMQRYLAMPELAWDFLTLHEPDAWNDYFALADLPRISNGDFRVGQRSYGLFGHNFRDVPIDALLELWTERALAEDPTVPPPRTRTRLLLSHPDFAEAVRQGLRDLHSPDLLARNPLGQTRLIGGSAADGSPDGERLAEVLRAAVSELATDPRNDKRYRAVKQTYVNGSGTQQAAAARLGMPFSTYRRHLAAAVEQVVDWCWQREVYGFDRPVRGDRSEQD